MQAPVRDYLSPRDPASTPLLCSTKERYFNRLSAVVGPAWPGLEDGGLIVSEDVDVEHLLDVFTTIMKYHIYECTRGGFVNVRASKRSSPRS